VFIPFLYLCLYIHIYIYKYSEYKAAKYFEKAGRIFIEEKDSKNAELYLKESVDAFTRDDKMKNAAEMLGKIVCVCMCVF